MRVKGEASIFSLVIKQGINFVARSHVFISTIFAYSNWWLQQLLSKVMFESFLPSTVQPPELHLTVQQFLYVRKCSTSAQRTRPMVQRHRSRTSVTWMIRDVSLLCYWHKRHGKVRKLVAAMFSPFSWSVNDVMCIHGLCTRLEFWPFSGPFRVQKIIFSFRKLFSQYSVPYRTRNPWHSEH